MKKKKISLSQVEDQVHYHRIGRLKKSVADQIHRRAADIYIDDNHLKHILLRHKDELEKVGLTPKMLVDLVVSNFNRIYKGHNESLQLVVWNGNAKVAIIEINSALKKEFYEVKTALIKAKENVNEADLLWVKKRKELV